MVRIYVMGFVDSSRNLAENTAEIVSDKALIADEWGANLKAAHAITPLEWAPDDSWKWWIK